MTLENNEWEKQFSDNLFKVGKRYQERFENAKGYYPHFWTEKKVCEELEKMFSSLLAQTRQDTVREVRNHIAKLKADEAELPFSYRRETKHAWNVLSELDNKLRSEYNIKDE